VSLATILVPPSKSKFKINDLDHLINHASVTRVSVPMSENASGSNAEFSVPRRASQGRGRSICFRPANHIGTTTFVVSIGSAISMIKQISHDQPPRATTLYNTTTCSMVWAIMTNNSMNRME
jgi:hypothetical protein